MISYANSLVEIQRTTLHYYSQMDTLAPALYVIALLLLAMEIVVPGGVMGTIGIICLLAATADIWVHYGANFGLVSLAASAVIALVLFLVELRFLRKGPLARWFCLIRQTPPTTGHSAESVSVGQTGKAATRMNPSGLVLIDGKRYEAISREGLIEAGVEISVVSDDPFRIVVERRQNP